MEVVAEVYEKAQEIIARGEKIEEQVVEIEQLQNEILPAEKWDTMY